MIIVLRLLETVSKLFFLSNFNDYPLFALVLKHHYIKHICIYQGFRIKIGVIVYDPTKNDWHPVDTILPKARFGSCALVHNDKIILIGGKGHMDDVNGSDELLEFDPNKKEWTTNDDKTWPKMKRQRYYHGCTLGTLDGEKGL